MKTLTYPRICGEMPCTLVIDTSSKEVKFSGGELRVGKKVPPEELDETLGNIFMENPGINKEAVTELIGISIPEFQCGILYHYILYA